MARASKPAAAGAAPPASNPRIVVPRDAPLLPIPMTLRRLGELGAAQFSRAETALALGTTEVELDRLFETHRAARLTFEIGRLRTLEALRGAQFALAQSNAAMAMFLGRIYLGQGDRREDEDGQGFDLAGASERVRNKIAAIAAAPSAPGDRQGD